MLITQLSPGRISDSVHNVTMVTKARHTMQCSFSNRVFATITCLAFAVLVTIDHSYPARTHLLASTFATCAGIWQVFGFRDHNPAGTSKLPLLTKP